MDRNEIIEGLREIGPCTTTQLVTHLCGDSPSVTNTENIRTKLYRLAHQGAITRADGWWSA